MMINKPFAVEQLKAMPVKTWVWIEVLQNDFQNIESAYYCKHPDYTHDKAFTCGYPGHGYEFDYIDYGKKWLAYKYQPVKEASQNGAE